MAVVAETTAKHTAVLVLLVMEGKWYLLQAGYMTPPEALTEQSCQLFQKKCSRLMNQDSNFGRSSQRSRQVTCEHVERPARTLSAAHVNVQ